MKKEILLLTILLTCSICTLGKNNKTNFIAENNFEKSFQYDDGLYYAVEPSNSGFSKEIYDNSYKEFIQPRQVIQPETPKTEDIYIANPSFMYKYYKNLGDNILTNHLGICGYTAIAMFLSYYDTYWNDDFILENYDSDQTRITESTFNNYNHQSPGVKNTLSTSPYISTLKNKIKKTGITDEDSIEFKEALDREIMTVVKKEIDNDSFAGKLFSIGIANGSITPHYNLEEYKYSVEQPDNSNIANEGYLSGIGVNNGIMNNVLSDYINKNERINGKVSIVTSKLENDSASEKNRIRNEIVNLVKAGKPVLMGGDGFDDKNNNGIQDNYGENDPRNENGFGHVVIAYYYDITTDTLYGNMGWGSSQSFRNLDEYFNIQMSDYWSLNISEDLPQSYTNNYYFTDKNTIYCPYKNSKYNTLAPIEYEFPESYGKGLSISSTISLPNSNDTVDIAFNRFRTGYIEKECINLSPRLLNEGTAYLEYKFSKKVKRINVDLSFWSSTEFITSKDSEYLIQYSIDGVWFTTKNLWTDVNLSKDRKKPTNVEVEFPESISNFRFYAKTEPIGDRNKGRLSIFDMRIVYDN